MLAAIELGGTKTVVAIGNAQGDIIEECRFPTEGPVATLGFAIDWLRLRGTPERLGIGSFGPIGITPGTVNYGIFLKTPKAGWSGFSLVEAFRGSLPKCQIILETDVNAAVFAEARIGAATGLEDVVYITIGTGVGAGILSNGRLVHGALHSEFGHLKVPRAPDDAYAGICPFHQDCLEGLASGPAMASRWGLPAHQLPAEHPAWEMEAWYLAHGILSFVAIGCPSRIIVGGGVSQAEGFHEKIKFHLEKIAAGYFPVVASPNYVLAPALGQEAGIRGALLLAAEAR